MRPPAQGARRTRRTAPTGALVVVLAAMAALTLAACSSSDREAIRSRASTAVSALGDEAQQAVDDARSKLGDTSQSVREAAIRNAVALAGPARFASKDVDVNAPLDCTVVSPAADQFTVTCTGTAKDGRPVSVSGSDSPDSKPNFVGSVAGQQVWSDCLGLC